jgi:GNAT superfamily N-acetyltransferase
MQLQLRQATLADAEVVARCSTEMAWETEYLRLDAERVRRGVEAALRDPSKGFYVVAVLDGKVVGQSMVTFEWSDWSNGMRWWVQSVYVSPEVRRRGVYRALFQYLLELARSDGTVCGLRLYVHRENRLAQTVYRRLGFREVHYLLYELGLPPQP